MINLDASEVNSLPGPIVVTGAGGFIGAHLVRELGRLRDDTIGFARSSDFWRSEFLAPQQIDYVDVTDDSAYAALLDKYKPTTVFNLAAYGGYSVQVHPSTTYRVNLLSVDTLSRWCVNNGAILIQAGSSSEYGTNCAAPLEDAKLLPNSLYAFTKASATEFLGYMSRHCGLRSAVARLYSVYGPLEDPDRLIPTLVRRGFDGELPNFSPRTVSRDFLHIGDALSGLVRMARFVSEGGDYEIFNLCSGVATTMEEVAAAAQDIFELDTQPKFAEAIRPWDLENWYGNPEKTKAVLGWIAKVPFRSGLNQTAMWYKNGIRRSFLSPELSVRQISEGNAPDPVDKKMVSAVIACYKDQLAIPVMYKRLTEAFEKSNVDHEIIFVNDCSPDGSIDEIARLSRIDHRVRGVSHSRNFGSQAAFISGLRISRGDACVLLDGDLQDPPELIPQFVEHWRDGNDVVYGRRVKRDAPLFMQWAYKQFYRLMSSVAQFRVPRDAGDFSLIDRTVVNQLLSFPERGLYIRAARAYLGHKQIGVDYVRPERMFGTTTNNLRKNIGWAAKGIISVSRTPINLLSVVGISLFGVSVAGVFIQIAVRLAFPESSPPGIISLITVSTLFGSLNLLAISIVGAYVGRILDESQFRPRYVVTLLIERGESLPYNYLDEQPT